MRSFPIWDKHTLNPQPSTAAFEQTFGYTRGMSSNPVNIYYVACRETGCWVLFDPKPPLPLSLNCRLHGHVLVAENVKQGNVTEFEAKQGWTKQKPD